MNTSTELLADAFSGPAADPVADRFRLAALLDVLSTGVLFLDATRRVVYCNQAFRKLWEFSDKDDPVGLLDAEITARTAALRVDDAAYRQHLRETVHCMGASAPYDIRLGNGKLLSEISSSVCGPDGEPIGRVWLFDDITVRRLAELRLTELAERDPLTGLYNRRAFTDELDRLLAEATRHGTRLGLLMFDLDAFKPVNDRHGHKAGDEVLIRLSSEVGNIIRRNEQFFRIGGDEFALLVPDTGEGELAGLAQRVLAAIDATSFRFDGEEVRVSASLGIAIYPVHAPDAVRLCERADAAMYRVKAAGRHGWAVFEAEAGL